MFEKDWLGEENQLGIDIWNKKYKYADESFEDWVSRVSGGNEEIAKYIKEKKFLFGGRILSNRGLHKEGRKVTYSNCYVIEPPADNIESIFDCAKKLARTYSYGGGCGIDISNLSPKGAKINNAAKETSGAVSFMELYSLVTGLIGQNGRRGALMISIDCKHPDLLDFIGLKTDLEKVTKANISIRIRDDFMDAVRENEEYTLEYFREVTGEKIEKRVNARELFRRIAETNWDYAEPGALFWDRVESWNLLSNTDEFKFAGVNPCAEEPLPAGGSCLLGSINLSAFVEDPFGPNAKFDFDSFRECVGASVRALNEVLDEGLPLHPLEEQQKSVERWRQIGLGIMGLADTMVKLGITYGEAEAIELSDKIGFAMADAAICASAKLAKEEGAYPGFAREEVMSTPFFMANTTEQTRELVRNHGLRNSQLLTIAPTGTISTMLGISGGIEPIYATYYERKTESLHGEDVYYKVYTKIVQDYMDKFGLISEADIPEFFVTAMTLGYKERIDMQSIWQEHIDASISSTVNVPNSFTVEETEKLYLYAHEKGLKGITIYRDGCARTGILAVEDNRKESDTKTAGDGLKRGEILLVSDDVIGKKRKLMTGCGSLHCIALFDTHNGALLETYLSKGSTGGCNNFMVGLSRMISISARGGIDINTIVDQLNSSGSCPSYTARRVTKKDTSKGACCPMAVGNALMEMYNEIQDELELKKKIGLDPMENVPKPKAVKPESDGKVHCPECGEPIAFEEGCNICKGCGWSKCH